MRCEYCYSHVHEYNVNYSEGDVVSDTINYLSSFTNFKHILIVFHGGEPLLTPILNIEAILQYIRDAFSNCVHVQIQTNGSLINDKWIDLFKRYTDILSVSISLDPLGVKELRVYPDSLSRNDIIENIIKCSKELDNVGVISVIHKHNVNHVIPFVEFLVDNGVSNLTLNKYQSNTSPYNDDNSISEMEYTDMIISVTKHIIMNRLYSHISIQPIYSLFSKSGSKICRYLPNNNKCQSIRTYFSHSNYTEYCDHLVNEVLPKTPEKCYMCDIYNKCGAGCLAEIKDSSFCVARRKLFHFIEGVKHEYYQP